MVKINYPIGNLLKGQNLEIAYESPKVEKQCTSLKEAKKLFSSDAKLAEKLFARINALKQASTLKDIVLQPQFHFHKLSNKGGRNLEGYFAIDIRGRQNPWRIILRPLDDGGNPFAACNIDEIASAVEIVEIMEVSKHYE